MAATRLRGAGRGYISGSGAAAERALCRVGGGVTSGLPAEATAEAEATRMEAVVRRCPFLARVSQAFLQKAGPSLLLYAQHCPKMMEAAPPAAARGLAGSAARGQQAGETPAAQPGE